MLCKNPFVRMPDPKDPKKYKIIKSGQRLAREAFPCGQCLPCRINKARNWTLRILLEMLDHGRCSFVTLTYSEENLPDNGSLCPKDVTLFFKRLRQNFREDDEKRADSCKVPHFRTIRYYYCGEYGEEKGRPHYHIALFGVSKVEEDLIEKAWTDKDVGLLGMVHLGELNKDSARYVANYVMKGMVNDRSDTNKKYLGGRYPEFQRMSRRPGLGANAIERIAIKSRTDKGFKKIKFGPRSTFLGRVLKTKVFKVIGVDDDGVDFNDYLLQLQDMYGKVGTDRDFKRNLVRGESQRRRILEKRVKRGNRRKKI